jgi:hypothetical protein
MELEVVNTPHKCKDCNKNKNKTLFDVHLKVKNHNIIENKNLIFIYYEFLNLKPLEVHIF